MNCIIEITMFDVTLEKHITNQILEIMDPQMYHYATVSVALDELKEKGYTVDFNNQEAKIINSPEEFTIEHVYRYEGASDPGDEAMVFGIKSSAGEKGVFVAGNSAFTENSAAMVLNELSIKNKKNPEEHPEMSTYCEVPNEIDDKTETK